MITYLCHAIIDDKELGLEPCSIWSCCGHAALHYARIVLDLSAVAPRSQISSQLQAINALDENDTPDATLLDSNQWIENAILGAMAHILEPIAATTAQPAQSEKQQASSGISGALTSQIFQETHGASLAIPTNYLNPVSKIKGNIVILLLDKEQVDAAATVVTGDDTTISAWTIGAHDVKMILDECFESLYDAARSSKVGNIHVDIVRITTNTNDNRSDILNYHHSKLFSASFYNVIVADENSITQAVSALYLRQNQRIEVLQIKGWPTVDLDRDSDVVELLCQSDHLGVVPRSKATQSTDTKTRCILQARDTQPIILEYGSKANGVYALPTKCAHPLTVSPTIFTSLFSAGSNGACHLLKRTSSEEASHAIYNHGGQIFLHCLETESERLRFEEAEEETTLKTAATKEPIPATTSSAIQLDDFVDAVVKRNTILGATMSFSEDSNSFTQVHPPAIHLPAHPFNESSANALDAASSLPPAASQSGGGVLEASPSTSSVNMSLVHTTTLMDLETRWLCQWAGGRPYTLSPAQESLLSKVRKVMCAPQVEPDGLQVIESVIEQLTNDARQFGQQQQIFDPLSGSPSLAPPQSGKGARRNTNKLGPGINTAQWILADLWMIGQRFKDVSKGHSDVAKLMSTKITPKGVDHAIVKQTLIPPQRRRQMAQQQQLMGQTPPMSGQPSTPQQQGGPRFQHTPRGGGMAGRGGRGGFRGNMQNQGNNPGNSNSPSAQSGGVGDDGEDGVLNDVMLSLTGKTQPVPYLVTEPPTREAIDEAELEYHAQMGEEGSLLQAYWGGRGAQRNNVINSHNPHQASSTTTVATPALPTGAETEAACNNSSGLLDSNTLSVALLPNMVGKLPPAPPNSLLGQYQQLYQKQQYMLARRQIKRPRLQDFAGRTPVAENGGFSGMI
ncbi:hypothetical protein BGW42_002543 [Actinomortierella wolfii]|nr:hypothetical protein BGW42_002543 [Actinomortierella wolfii]